MIIASLSETLNSAYLVIGIVFPLVLFLVGTYGLKVRSKALQSEVITQQKDDAVRVSEETNKTLLNAHYVDQLQITAKEKEAKLLTENNQTLLNRIEALENMKTQAPQIVELMKQNATQHTEVMVGISNLIKAISKERKNGTK